MMDKIAKCGCDCFNCPTFKDNIRTIDERIKCSAGWNKYLDIKLSPEKLRACDGCSIPNSQRKIYYLNCKARKCAITNGFDNCAFCKGFPCEELLEVHSIQKIKDRKAFIRKTGKEITDQEYQEIIEPYTGINHLTKIRQHLKVKDLRDFKEFSAKVKFAGFENSYEELEGLMEIHSLLTTMYVSQNVSYARLQTLETKRGKLLKILWAIGLYGKLKEAGRYVELDGKSFLSQKILSMYKVLLDNVNDLEKIDIHCEIIPLVVKGWLTPSGGLRKEGWIIRLSFGESLNGCTTLKKFMDYILKLNERYGKKGFRLFNRADLSIMID